MIVLRPSYLLALIGISLLLENGTYSLAQSISTSSPAGTSGAKTKATVVLLMPATFSNGVSIPFKERSASQSSVQFDFGVATHGTTVKHKFILTNATQSAMSLDHIQSSCGCTSAVVEEKGKNFPFVLPPGQQVAIEVSVDSTNLAPGLLHKAVWVYLKGQSSPAATLDITGILKTGAFFSPSTLNFDKVAVGTDHSMLLSLTTDPKIILNPATLRLIASNSDLAVSEVKASSSAINAAPVRMFQVSLTRSVHLGQLNTMLLLLPAVQSPNQGGAPLATVPVLGEVTGELSASPGVAMFGAVPLGKAATLRITLTAASLSVLQGLSISSAYRDVSARILPVDPSQNLTEPNQRILEVTVNPHLTGSLETQVFVTTASGQQLLIPVNVSVAGATHS